MKTSERKQAENELKTFASRNFEKPMDCKNLEQIRFYVRELCLKIEELEQRFDHVPNSAYSLLAQYNTMQNSIISKEFSTTEK
jgi:hypothetical protein